MQKIVHGLLKVPKKGPKKVLSLKIVPKIALLKALFGDQNLYDGPCMCYIFGKGMGTRFFARK